jgi:hypothetical protein
VRRPRGERELIRAAAALSIQLRRDGERLDERRLAASVLPDEKRHTRVQLDSVDLGERRKLIRVVALLVGKATRTDPDRMDERRRGQSCHHMLIMPR